VQILRSVILPLSVPAPGRGVLFPFCFAWNDFFVPNPFFLYLSSKPTSSRCRIAIQRFNSLLRVQPTLSARRAIPGRSRVRFLPRPSRVHAGVLVTGSRSDRGAGRAGHPAMAWRRLDGSACPEAGHPRAMSR